MTPTNLDIPSDLYLQRISPDCHEEIINICFDTELDFQIWFKNVAAHHASWTIRTTHYSSANFKLVEGLPESSIAMIKLPKEMTYYICDHAGTYKKKTSSNEPPLKKQRKTKESIKVGCTAKLTKTILYNSNVEVMYIWKHINHSPLELSDMVSSRLPTAIKWWIKKQVDSNMDWKAIKAGLCMTDEELDTFNLSNVIPKIPAGLIISYQDVQNIILARMNSLARKHFQDQESVCL
ncbi:hypothetical protein BDF14DRAFT_1741585 [Spinellus fusiger]|nr:hypothetical protein BDF14DRAFT_1741585 [Spinellus fusiger]